MDIRAAVEATMKYVTDEFIVEECVGNMVEGCLSCEMIEVRSSLRKIIHIMDEQWEFTPAQLDAHP
jgi:hypothetical protein